MFTVVGYFESQDSAALINVAAIQDPHVRVVGDDVIVPPPVANLAGYWAGGADITLARIVSPSLRRIANIDIGPVGAATEPASPMSFGDLFENPVPLFPNEPINVQMAEDGGAASAEYALLFLADGPVSQARGSIRTIRATNADTLVANRWTNGGLTFQQTLAGGRYRVVGMRYEGAGAIAARLVFAGGTWRPGCPGVDLENQPSPLRFRYGNAGVWGEFDPNQPPTVDFLSLSADTSQVIFLDVIPVGIIGA